MDVHAGMLHDAVLLWAYAVNKTITALGASELDNGTAVTANVMNFTFEGTLEVFGTSDAILLIQQMFLVFNVLAIF